ncbi:MAG: hypothetical protein CBR30_01695 [Dictyoglomus sp. NZ13-RE01]|nr:MAG: hypothetical protein CBR30_01695 [Dictyoglomus sp. NZ13-RE01]
MKKVFVSLLILFLFLLTISFSEVDTMPPKVSIVNLKNGQTVSGVITIQVNASDNVGVAKVEFYIDNRKVGEDDESPYEFEWNTLYYPNKVYNLAVIAYDESGNKSAVRINIIVNNTAPINVWQKTFGGTDEDGANSIQQTSDGGYIVAGYTYSFGAGWSDVYILKLDENGNLLWQKTFGGSSDDEANSIQQTSDGGYIVAGYTYSFGAGGDVYILKLDADGNLVWKKTFGGSSDDEANSIQQTSDGGYIVAGYTSSFGAGGRDVYILKLDANGNLVWQKTFGGSGWDEAYSIQQTSDSGYIVAGYTESFGDSDEDVYILKIDENGELVWEKIFGGKYYDVVSSIQQTSDGGYIVAGYTKSFGAGGRDVYILKLDANGELVWQKTFGGWGGDEARSIQQTSDGGYIVAGYTTSFGARGSDVYILKLDANGELVWQKNFGGDSSDGAFAIQQTSDGGYIVAGNTESFGAGKSDVYILKLDADGNTGPYPTK